MTNPKDKAIVTTAPAPPRVTAPVCVPAPDVVRTNKWRYTLCDLGGWCKDPQVCCCALCCCPCAVAQQSAQLDNNIDPLLCLYPASVWKNRMQAEAQYGIEPRGCAANCFLTTCCGVCSTAQIQREINAHRQILRYQAAQQPTGAPAPAQMTA